MIESDTMIDETYQLRQSLNQALDLIQRMKAEADLRKNINFIQISRNSMAELRRLQMQDQFAAYLLFLFAEKANKQNAVMMSIRTIEQITGKTKRTILRAIKRLRDERWIQIVKVGTSSVYVLNNIVFWSDYAHRKYATFGATIVASQTEQIENWEGIQLKHFPFIIRDEPNEKEALPDDYQETPTIGSEIDPSESH